MTLPAIDPDTVMEFIQNNPGTTRLIAAGALDVTKQTLNRYVRELISDGKVFEQARNKQVRYLFDAEYARVNGIRADISDKKKPTSHARLMLNGREVSEELYALITRVNFINSLWPAPQIQGLAR